MKDQKGNNDLLNLTRPEVVRSICDRFAEAGAELLATNTFNANAISQADYGAEALVAQINEAAARLTREVADAYTARDGKPRWVAGAMGPTNKTLSLSPNVNDPGYREVDFDEVKAVYREQVDALGRRRRGLHPHRDDLRYAQRQGGGHGDAGSGAGARPRASADDFNDPDRP